jgi:radical SAM superfamily enzyme YgiQ (UPF0313 family)
MDVLLINPPWKTKKGNIWNSIAGCIPPLGLAQLASYIARDGLRVFIVDSNADKISIEEIPGKIRELNISPVFIGITSTTSIINQAIAAAKVCKENYPQSKIIMGGVHPTLFPDEMLQNIFIDFVVRNEGEETLLELVSGNDVSSIQGLSYRVNGVVKHNQAREFLKSLDDLPFPAYHLLPMKKYRPALGGYKQLPGTGLITTRGCPGRCTFCCGQYFGTKIRTRSAKKIFEEIKLLNKDYGIKEIAFYDDTFTAFKQNVVDLCDLLIASGLNITWSCFARVDFVSEELLMLMKKAGCHQICFGVETASQEILNNIKKHTSLDKASSAVALTKKCGIEARITLMLGNPGETVQTMEDTLKFAIELDPDIALFNITTPYPGTEMYNWAKENNYLITTDWSQYDLSHPVMAVPGLDVQEISKFYKKVYSRFYGRPSYILKQVLRMTNITNITAGFRALKAVTGVLMNR